MTRTSLRACAAALSLAVVTLPGAAFAQGLTHRDPAHDVQRIDGSTTTNVPTNKSADITRVAVAHGMASVTVKLRLRALGSQWTSVEIVKTPTATYQVMGSHSPGSTTLMLTKGSTSTPVTCSGLSYSLATSEGTFGVTIPRSCLGAPRWVQVGVGFLVQTRHGFLADDGLRKRGAAENNLTLTKRLTRA